MKQKTKKTVELVNFLHHILNKKKLLKSNQSMVLAISGGQDSISLFFIFLQLKDQWNWKLSIIYCNHLWQKDSFYTMLHLFKLAYLLNIPIYLTVTLQNIFTEQKARNWRSLTFQRITGFYLFSLIVLGHSKSDRVETGLFNLFRGSSTKGVSSLNWTKVVLKDCFFKLSKTQLNQTSNKNNIFVKTEFTFWERKNTNLKQKQPLRQCIFCLGQGPYIAFRIFYFVGDVKSSKSFWLWLLTSPSNIAFGDVKMSEKRYAQLFTDKSLNNYYTNSFSENIKNSNKIYHKKTKNTSVLIHLLRSMISQIDLTNNIKNENKNINIFKSLKPKQLKNYTLLQKKSKKNKKKIHLKQKKNKNVTHFYFFFCTLFFFVLKFFLTNCSIYLISNKSRTLVYYVLKLNHAKREYFTDKEKMNFNKYNKNWKETKKNLCMDKFLIKTYDKKKNTTLDKKNKKKKTKKQKNKKYIFFFLLPLNKKSITNIIKKFLMRKVEVHFKRKFLTKTFLCAAKLRILLYFFFKKKLKKNRAACAASLVKILGQNFKSKEFIKYQNQKKRFKNFQHHIFASNLLDTFIYINNYYTIGKEKKQNRRKQALTKTLVYNRYKRETLFLVRSKEQSKALPYIAEGDVRRGNALPYIAEGDVRRGNRLPPFGGNASKFLSRLYKHEYLLVRPFLSLTRFDLKKVCNSWKIPLFPDQSNQKLKYQRNRIRKQILPTLRFFFNPQIDTTISQFIEIINSEQEYMNFITGRIVKKIQYKKETVVQLETSFLAVLPIALRRMVIKQFLEKIMNGRSPFKFFDIEKLLQQVSISRGLIRQEDKKEEKKKKK